MQEIRNEHELNEAICAIDALLDKESLTPSESDHLDVLGNLVSKYEAKQHPIETVSDSAIIAHLLESSGLTQAEVARRTRISNSTLSAVSSGKRKLTHAHIEKIAEVFNVSSGVFYTSVIQ